MFYSRKYDFWDFGRWHDRSDVETDMRAEEPVARLTAVLACLVPFLIFFAPTLLLGLALADRCLVVTIRPHKHGRRKRGDGGTRPPQSKYLGETSPPKIRMKISNSDYFNGFKIDLFQFHHNFSIVVAVLDRTKPIHVLISLIKTHAIPLIRPERDR